jgi:hypothetical protein
MTLGEMGGSPRLLAVEKTKFHGNGHRMGTVVCAEFGKDALHVPFHRCLGDV